MILNTNRNCYIVTKPQPEEAIIRYTTCKSYGMKMSSKSVQRFEDILCQHCIYYVELYYLQHTYFNKCDQFQTSEDEIAFPRSFQASRMSLGTLMLSSSIFRVMYFIIKYL